VKPTVFIYAVREEDKGPAIQSAAAHVRTNSTGQAVYVVDPTAFGQIPGTPFSYRVTEPVRHLFVTLPAYGQDGRSVKQGLASADDFRFVRLWSEVSNNRIVTGPPNATPQSLRTQTHKGKPWVPFAKGGTYSPYYADLDLVVNWEGDGRGIKALVDSESGKVLSRAQNTESYFLPGLTYPRRLARLAAWPLPKGSIISVRGSGIYASQEDLMAVLALTCSWPFDALAKLLLGRVEHPQYDNGALEKVPIPHLSDCVDRLTPLARTSVDLKRSLAKDDEVTHLFVRPIASAGVQRGSLSDESRQLSTLRQDVQRKLDTLQSDMDVAVLQAYGLQPSDEKALCATVSDTSVAVEDQISLDETDDEENTVSQEDLGLGTVAVTLLSYAVGCVFGRWDIRYATGEKTPPELPDPFAPLPVCSPGMLQGEDGLPLTATPPGYPLHINWNGILVDDGSHSDDDIVQRVREVLHVLWPATSESIEAEMCAALGVKDLHDYFRKSGSDGFWMDHVHMYSKSHRKAPIYWLLQSSRKSYGVWLYYQRLDSDLLFKALQNYVEPKLKLEQNHETEASHKLSAGGLSVSETRQTQKDLEHQQDLVAEIREFRDTLKKAADLRLTPDLDDGVVLNIAPLHDLAPWSEASKYWNELQAGKHPWSSIGKQLEQKGMV